MPGAPSSSLRVARTLLPGSYMQGAYGPMLLSPGVLPMQGWSPYSVSTLASFISFFLIFLPFSLLILISIQAPVSPALSPGANSLYGVPQLSSTTPSLPGVYPSLPSPTHSFPERPGELECQYYLKTGDCKFGTSCKFHHPRHRVPPSANCNLSPIGLPLRPVISSFHTVDSCNLWALFIIYSSNTCVSSLTGCARLHFLHTKRFLQVWINM